MWKKSLVILIVGLCGLVLLSPQNLFAQSSRVPLGPSLDCRPGRSSAPPVIITVEGQAWLDDNAFDGLSDVGSGMESKMNGVLVTLTCKSKSTGTTVTKSEGTGDDAGFGNYDFDIWLDSAPNTNWEFELSFAPSATYAPTWSNAGANDALDSDVDASGSLIFTVDSTTTPLVYDAGFVEVSNNPATAVISGTVWVESTQNGLFDSGEKVRSNVPIDFECPTMITDGLSTQTDLNGDYSFNLWYDPAAFDDTCDVSLTVPSGFYLTTQDAGLDDTIDSDFSPLTNNVSMHIDSTFTGQDNDAGLTTMVPTAVGLQSAEIRALEGVRLILAITGILISATHLLRRKR